MKIYCGRHPKTTSIDDNARKLLQDVCNKGLWIKIKWVRCKQPIWIKPIEFEPGYFWCDKFEGSFGKRLKNERSMDVDRIALYESDVALVYPLEILSDGDIIDLFNSRSRKI